MLRYDIINDVINKHNFKTYLEIGVCDPSVCFDKVICDTKHGVDPGVEFEDNPVDYKMTSDDFFYFLDVQEDPRKYDVVFIDGLHKSYQVKTDIVNSLRYLNPNGYIILHDCNPPDIHMAREDYMVNGRYEPWNGTTWKAIYWARTHRTDLNVLTVDTDWGIGIIRNNLKLNTPLVQNHNPFYEFNIMDANREEDLGLISINDFKNYIADQN
jgi:hypothetical protein